MAAKIGDYELSPREFAFLEMAAEGHPTKVVRARLKMSSTTEKPARKRLYDRMGAKNTAHAVAIAIRLGILK